MQPVINAVMAATNTAAAEISLMFLISVCCFSEMKSIIFSIAVLNSSAVQTNPVTIQSTIASIVDIATIRAVTPMASVIKKCIRRLCSVARAFRSPLTAY